MGDGLDDVNLGLLAVGLDDRETQGRDPAHWVAGFADDVGACSEPLFDLMGAGEEVGNGSESQFGHVETRLVGFVLAQEVLVPQLPVDLFSCSDEGYTIDARHDCLLDGLSLDVVW